MKKVKYPNLNDYDLSAYEELKGDVLYKINGGAMSEADQAAMAKQGVEKKTGASSSSTSSYKTGKEFEGYNLLNKSCGIIARDSLNAEGSGISKLNPYCSINHLFAGSIPNEIGANLILANEGSYLETLRQ